MSDRRNHKSLKRRIAPAIVGAVCMAAAKSATAQTAVAVPLALSGWNNNPFFGTAENSTVVFPGVGATGGGSALPHRTMDTGSNSPFLNSACCETSVPNADGLLLGAYYKSAATSLVSGDSAAYFAFNGQANGFPGAGAPYNVSIAAVGTFNNGQDEAAQLYNSVPSVTLTMENPSRVKNLYLYMTTGNGPGTVTVTFNYANSHSYSFTETVPDWYYANGSASDNAFPDAGGFDLVSVSTSTTSSYETGTSTYNDNRQIYQFDVSAPDTTDKLNSITFNSSLSSPTQINIMAVSATSAVPAPPSALPFLMGSGLGCLKLLRRRRCKAGSPPAS